MPHILTLKTALEIPPTLEASFSSSLLEKGASTSMRSLVELKAVPERIFIKVYYVPEISELAQQQVNSAY